MPSLPKTTAAAGAAAVRKILLDQWVSEPLLAQTITGTFTGQVRFDISSTTSTTGQGFVYLRIINPDGSIATEVGTATTTNLSTTLTNRTLIALNVGTLNITAGQRICVDLGWNYSFGTNTTRTCIMSRGSSSGTDLPVNNTTTTANSPWFQFSQTLLFEPSLATSAIIDYGKTYLNITAGTVGGTINPGDELEIRATLVVKEMLPTSTGLLTALPIMIRFRPGLGFGYVPEFISLRTNEGKIYKSFLILMQT
ncbi:MAG: hypothetical protein IPG38_02390 [Chitinophagaceae bacterium]|nr:hypothetical protein [Chitinophagaceae bacterium]